MSSRLTRKRALEAGLWRLAIELDGPSPSVHKAAAFWELNNLEEARREYLEAWNTKRDRRALGPLSRLLAEEEWYSALSSILEDALALGYEIPARRLLGNCRADQGDLEGAEIEFQSAIEVGDAEAIAELGYLLLNQHGRSLDGVALLRQAWAKGDAAAASWMARHYLEREEWRNALKWAGRAITGGELDALVAYGEAQLELGRFELARAALEDARSLNIQDAAIALAQFAVRRGDLATVHELVSTVASEGKDRLESLLALVRSEWGAAAAESLAENLH